LRRCRSRLIGVAALEVTRDKGADPLHGVGLGLGVQADGKRDGSGSPQTTRWWGVADLSR